ncbi:peptidoglycan DD-metalloendopeptidase family protein [Salinivibrio kushneri]|uniref:peptidoglycan DD-metalloendopeptidase family protein n=1 Tax=Salinivibrio kushneri TaxID=1908198 RepID=UPI0009874229|nr:peptidoglycan DD-metalloendopeptidase family protein [Salinivibrio kushneri]OOE53331.1 peptidase M23 [Salinivibrio kushneri]OOE55622.1 peptidase M23 [Salinivibrio kushneri]OOE62534.1 peptidase M23 [Salinivibrio kushneri]
MPLNKLAALPKLHKLVIGALSAFIVLLMLVPDGANTPRPKPNFEPGKHYPLPVEAVSLLPPKDEMPAQFKRNIHWQTYEVQPGESMALLFSRAGLSPTTLYRLVNADERTQSLAYLNPGDEVRLGVDDDGELVQLIQPRGSNETLIVNKIDESYQSRLEAKHVDTQLNFARATIKSNFWQAASDAGLNPNQIMQLAGIFGWDVDFALDIRNGDSFSVLYEEEFVEGEHIGSGNILAATFTNRGDTFTAVRAKNGKYYTPSGKAMKKAFLRSPVNFRYVSSNFNPRRLHPVTGRVKPHRGTDYVAPVGTPIKAAGDGVVMKASYNRFNGNYVFIRHSSTYITKYLHLTKRKVKTGQRVKQGDIIGTLGSTGRVTGAHLHYEFLVHGVHKNPRTVKLPEAKSLQGEQKKAFVRLAESRMAQLSKFNQLLATVGSLNHYNRGG